MRPFQFALPALAVLWCTVRQKGYKLELAKIGASSAQLLPQPTLDGTIAKFRFQPRPTARLPVLASDAESVLKKRPTVSFFLNHLFEVNLCNVVSLAFGNLSHLMLRTLGGDEERATELSRDHVAGQRAVPVTDPNPQRIPIGLGSDELSVGLFSVLRIFGRNGDQVQHSIPKPCR